MAKTPPETCSSGCPRPPESRLPWPVRAAWYLWDLATWPATVRQLKRHGFRRIGWRAWEAGPADEKLLRTALDDEAHALTEGQLRPGSLDRIRDLADGLAGEDGCGCKGPWHG